jgi:hypothetical protein
VHCHVNEISAASNLQGDLSRIRGVGIPFKRLNISDVVMRRTRAVRREKEHSMIRKLLFFSAAIATPLGLIAVTGGSASAGAPPAVNATNNTVSCSKVSGSAMFNPALTSSEPAGTTVTTITAKLSDCRSNATGLTVKSGSVSGTVSDTHGAEDGCMSLVGLTTVTGTLTTTWKTSPQLSSGNSVTTVNSVEGSVAGDGLAKFNIPGAGGTASGTGSFSGTDGGAASMFSVLTARKAASILSTCNRVGLTSITVDHAKKGPNTMPTAAIFG